ncbi:MAG: hypothetical protein IPL81_14540 [Flavobacteriales bacterium]|nr:hypothetical protein [Flavobacteriales bacterium]
MVSALLQDLLKKEHYDFHLRPSAPTQGHGGRCRSRYINLGDWITWFTYAVFDESGMRLMKRSETDLMQDDRQVSGGPAK